VIRKKYFEKGIEKIGRNIFEGGILAFACEVTKEKY
jgi:hypothetical protein